MENITLTLADIGTITNYINNELVRREKLESMFIEDFIETVENDEMNMVMISLDVDTVDNKVHFIRNLEMINEDKRNDKNEITHSND